MSLGFKLASPEGTYARLAPRSGLAANKMIGVGAGVIDRDYVGECAAILFNLGQEPFEIKVGDRVAQLVFELVKIPPIVQAAVVKPDSQRGAGGFGSTGVKGASVKPGLGEKVRYGPHTQYALPEAEAVSEAKAVPVPISAGDVKSPCAGVGIADSADAVCAASDCDELDATHMGPEWTLDIPQDSIVHKAIASQMRKHKLGEVASREPVVAQAGNPVSFSPGLGASSEKPVPGASLKEPLKHASRENAEKLGHRSWSKPGFAARKTSGQQAWLERLKRNDLSGFETPLSAFNSLRGECLKSNPRSEESYRQGALISAVWVRSLMLPSMAI